MINNLLSVSGHRRSPRRSFVPCILLVVLFVNICLGMPTPDEESFSREVSGKMQRNAMTQPNFALH